MIGHTQFYRTVVDEDAPGGRVLGQRKDVARGGEYSYCVSGLIASEKRKPR